MGKTIIMNCDECNSHKDVHPVTVVRTGDERQAWEIELCDTCYNKAFRKLMRISHSPTVNLKPRRAATKTQITEANL